MSLATLIPALEDKFHSLRNSTFDFKQTETFPLSNDSSSNSTGTNIRNLKLESLQPLTMTDENIPYADDSPDQQPALIPPINAVKVHRSQLQGIPTSMRYKAWHSTSTDTNIADLLLVPKSYTNPIDSVDTKSTNSISSDDTDESNTSDLIENQTIRINREMIREMNRILTTLERKATKLNRSLSLNIKYHNSECCCNNVVNNSNHSSCRSIAATQRYSLTKDEKTDKNINKKRQIQDIKNKRYTNRPIKRRHTVGGIHYYGYTKTSTAKQHQTDGSNNR